MPETKMPIRAAPFAHQREAYDFALKLFGVETEKDDETEKTEKPETNQPETKNTKETEVM